MDAPAGASAGGEPAGEAPLGGLRALFVADGAATFAATELTRGPWSPLHQHGGPPSALLGRALEREAARGAAGPARVVQVTIDFLRPIPIGRLRPRARIVKDGKKALVLEASLEASGREVARASARAVRVTEVEVPAAARLAADPDPPPGPAGHPPFVLPFFQDVLGYHRAMELRIVRGRFASGRAAGWMRMRVPLVLGEEPSPLERVLCAADSGQGISMALDVRAHTFVNADLAVHIHRPLAGPWVCLDARAAASSDGTGFSDVRLWDEQGPIGRALQSLVIEPR